MALCCRFDGRLQWILFCSVLLFANVALADEVPSAAANDIPPLQQFEQTVDPIAGQESSGAEDEGNSTVLDGLSDEQLEQMGQSAKAFAFQTEQDRLMKLIVNSLYKNKDIFLRELISNGCDANDKIRHKSLTDSSVLKDFKDLAIWIKVSKDKNMIHITDSGIGMTEPHLREYLGTIARSQTSEFLKTMEEGKTTSEDLGALNDVIGQFGVGFYSVFLVADKVYVTSKHNNDSQHIWESDSKQFRISKDPRGDTLPRGTTVSILLKEEATEYLDIYKLRKIILKYSQYVNYPIYLWNQKEVERVLPEVDEAQEVDEKEEPKPRDDSTAEEVADREEKPKGEPEEDEVKVSDVEEEKKDKKKKKKPKKIKELVWGWDHVNDVKPLWQRKHDVTEQEYIDFYKAMTKRNEEPLAYVHFFAEGDVNFKAIVFIPRTTTPMYASSLNKERLDNIKLYVRRVFITDQTDLVPSYLNFIVGIVDSDDLSLNISREELQQSSILKTIRKKLVRKILDTLKNLNATRYEEFWKEFGTNMKFGINEDSLNRIRLAKLLRFHSSFSTREGKQNFTGLEDYISRARKNQKSIYYVSAESLDKAKRSPFTERLTRQGNEVLYLVDAMDQICVQHLPEFAKMKFQNAAKEGLDVKVSRKEKKKREELEKQYEPLTRWLEDAFSDKVIKVLISDRLVETPMVFVAAHWGYDGNMERISKAQAYQKVGGDSSTVHFANMKRKLEINPRHPLIKAMLKRVNNDRSDSDLREIAEICVDSALIRSGYDLRDPAMFTGRIETMLRQAMKIPEHERVEPEMYGYEEEEDDEEPEKAEETKSTLDVPHDNTNQEQRHMDRRSIQQSRKANFVEKMFDKKKHHKHKHRHSKKRRKLEKAKLAHPKRDRKSRAVRKNESKKVLGSKTKVQRDTYPHRGAKRSDLGLQPATTTINKQSAKRTTKRNVDEACRFNESAEAEIVCENGSTSPAHNLSMRSKSINSSRHRSEKKLIRQERAKAEGKERKDVKAKKTSAKTLGNHSGNTSGNLSGNEEADANEFLSGVRSQSQTSWLVGYVQSRFEILWTRVASMLSRTLDDSAGSRDSSSSVRPRTNHIPGFAMAFQVTADSLPEPKPMKRKTASRLPEGVRMTNGKLAVGYQYRYRLSNFLRSREGEKWSKRHNKTATKKIVAEEAKDNLFSRVLIKKPSVGYRYRYRISNYLKTLDPSQISELKSDGYLIPIVINTVPGIKIDDILKDYSDTAKNNKSTLMAIYVWRRIKELVSYQHCVEWIESNHSKEEVYLKSANPLTNKIGYEYRYRLSNKLKAEAQQKVGRVDNVTHVKRKPKHVPSIYRYRVTNMLKALGLRYEEMVRLLDNQTWDDYLSRRQAKLDKDLGSKRDNRNISVDTQDNIKLVGAPADLESVRIPIKELFPEELINVGYEYRYRRSRKMKKMGISPSQIDKRRWELVERQLKENTRKLILNKTDDRPSKKLTKDGVVFTLDYSQLTPDERKAGYEHRYRISRKFQNQVPRYVLHKLKNDSSATVSNSSVILETIKAKQQLDSDRRMKLTQRVKRMKNKTDGLVNRERVKELLKYLDENAPLIRNSIIQVSREAKHMHRKHRKATTKGDNRKRSVKHAISDLCSDKQANHTVVGFENTTVLKHKDETRDFQTISEMRRARDDDSETRESVVPQKSKLRTTTLNRGLDMKHSSVIRSKDKERIVGEKRSKSKSKSRKKEPILKGLNIPLLKEHGMHMNGSFVDLENISLKLLTRIWFARVQNEIMNAMFGLR